MLFLTRKYAAPYCYFNKVVCIYIRLTSISCAGLKRSGDANCNSLPLFPWIQDRKKEGEFYCTKDVCTWFHFFALCRHKGRRKSGSCVMVVLVSFMFIASVNTRASQRRKYSWDKGIFRLCISARLRSVITRNFYLRKSLYNSCCTQLIKFLKKNYIAVSKDFAWFLGFRTEVEENCVLLG